MANSKWVLWGRVKYESYCQYLPGLLASTTIALAASFLSERYGGPLMLYALLLGIAFNFLSEEGPCLQGVEIAARSILRIGVALLGVRITMDQVMGLGIGPIVTVVAGVISTIILGGLIARVLGLSKEQGLLSGGAVAICGASAALALSAVMPKNENSERNTILTVVGVTTLSTVAMVLYPMIAVAFNFDPASAGIFLGGTIHDVAQVVGAGYMMSPETGDISTYVKLLRVAMLVPVVFCFSVIFRFSQSQAGGSKKPMLPGFLVVFAVLVIINSMKLIPDTVVNELTNFSRWCLVIAISALGIKTSFKKLAIVGWTPVIMMVVETVFLAVFVFTALLLGVAS